MNVEFPCQNPKFDFLIECISEFELVKEITCLDVSTTPITAMGCRNGVVVTFGPCMEGLIILVITEQLCEIFFPHVVYHIVTNRSTSFLATHVFY